MLQKSTRRNLIKHNWLYIAEHDTNQSQTFHRIRSMVNRALDDFSLLAIKLPEEKQEELFNIEKTKNFVESLLTGPDGDMITTLRYPRLQIRRSKIALMLIELGLRFLMSQDSLLLKRTPSFHQTTSDQLIKSIQICREISDEVEARVLESSMQKEKIVHIFNWNSVPGKHERKLQDFLIEEIDMGFIPIDSFKTKKDAGTKRIECRMGFPAGSYFDVLIQINDRTDKALLTIKNNSGKEIHKKELIVNKDGNSVHILKKCNDVEC